jgi:sortase A
MSPPREAGAFLFWDDAPGLRLAQVSFLLYNLPAMSRRKAPEDLTVEELRRLLIEKRRGARRGRLEHFRRTGRVVAVTPDLPPPSLSDLTADPVAAAPEATTEASPRRRLYDRILLGVEVVAILAFVGMLLVGLGMLRDINQEALASFNIATAQPTPLVTAVILPSGHTPPDAQGNTKFNLDEIPEHLRPLIQSMPEVAAPAASPEQAIRIQIPAIKVDAPIVQGDGWEQLKKGIAQHIGSADPGEIGNVVLSAHNDVYGELFRYLDKLAPGDKVILFTQQRQYVYIVTQTIIVQPTQVEVMAATAEPTVTLISCYPYLVDKQRIVVFATLQN